jgi:hypothetical protein
MKLHCDFSFGRRDNTRFYPAGTEVPWYCVYPFFLVHILGFGTMTYVLAYAGKVQGFWLYLIGGFPAVGYCVFYLCFFGRDEVKWMFINAALGLLGIYTQMGWLLSLFGKKISDYPPSVHVVPFLYFVLYTFLLRHAILDITQSRENPQKKKLVENGYIAISVAIYVLSYFLEKL